MRGLLIRLRARTRSRLPAGWRKGRKCPQCEVEADRPKCFLDLGGYCPRSDPDSYEHDPRVAEPDPLCSEAADEIDRLFTQVATLPDEAARLRALVDRLARALAHAMACDMPGSVDFRCAGCNEARATEAAAHKVLRKTREDR